MGKNSKRSKSYYINCAKRKKLKNEISSNMVGFLCTSNNNREKECVREAYNILNEYAAILYKNESQEGDSINKLESSMTSQGDKAEENDSDEIEDIETALKDEIAEIKSGSKSLSKRRFQQVMVHVNSCIFIKADVPDPLDLSIAIMENILETKKAKTRNLIRMVPVHTTCKAYIDEIKKFGKQLITERFPKDLPINFYVSFKARNNHSIDKETVCKTMSKFVYEFNPLVVADYKTPQLVINVEVVKNICCLSILPEYLTKYCKYNLVQLMQIKGNSNETKLMQVRESTEETKENENETKLEQIEESTDETKLGQIKENTDEAKLGQITKTCNETTLE